MKIEHLGTEYGGWWCIPELIQHDGVVIDAGVGTDVSFARALADRLPKLRFIGIDHTEDAEKWVAHCAIPGYRFIRAALAGPQHGDTITMFKHRTRSGSESIFPDHNFADPGAPYHVPAVHLETLVREHHPCLVKLDIEGAEYELYRECLGAGQVCIEFHHRMMKKYTEADTTAAIQWFLDNGYRLMHRTPTDEVLLVLADLIAARRASE